MDAYSDCEGPIMCKKCKRPDESWNRSSLHKVHLWTHESLSLPYMPPCGCEGGYIWEFLHFTKDTEKVTCKTCKKYLLGRVIKSL